MPKEKAEKWCPECGCFSDTKKFKSFRCGHCVKEKGDPIKEQPKYITKYYYKTESGHFIPKDRAVEEVVKPKKTAKKATKKATKKVAEKKVTLIEDRKKPRKRAVKKIKKKVVKKATKKVAKKATKKTARKKVVKKAKKKVITKKKATKKK